jgi:glycosyltransferase involved in cell wall biosynthesis
MTIALFMPAFSGGGSARVMLALAGGFREAGHEVDMVVTRARGPLLDEVPEGVRLVDLGAPRIVAAFPRLVRYLRETRPEAMLSALRPANCMAVWARKVAGVSTRLVLTEHNTLSVATAEAKNWRDRILPWIMRPSYRRADAVVAVSAGVADDLARVIGLPRERIDVIFNPVVTQELLEKAREPVDHPWFGEGQPPVFLGVGRIIRQKDFPTLIRAFAQVRQARPARLLILGEGEERATLEALIEEHGLSADVGLPGFVANPFAYMRNAEVFVLSSRWEGLPTVLIEALASGARVVSTRCPSGPEEILEDGQWGELVPMGDPAALAEAMLRALDAPAGRGSERARAFTPERATGQYLERLGVTEGGASAEGARRQGRADQS